MFVMRVMKRAYLVLSSGCDDISTVGLLRNSGWDGWEYFMRASSEEDRRELYTNSAYRHVIRGNCVETPHGLNA